MNFKSSKNKFVSPEINKTGLANHGCLRKDNIWKQNIVYPQTLTRNGSNQHFVCLNVIFCEMLNTV